MKDKKPACVLCGKADTELPLIKLTYNSGDYFLCPEHMPMLIHQPTALVGKLPGAENMNAG
jgi:hypothetical protein